MARLFWIVAWTFSAATPVIITGCHNEKLPQLHFAGRFVIVTMDVLK